MSINIIDPREPKKPKQTKPKRAKTKRGKFKADDPTTPDVNEAWVSGKSPKKKKARKSSKSK